VKKKQLAVITTYSVYLYLAAQILIMQEGSVESWPRTLLRIEGAAIFGSAIWAYSQYGHSWWTFAGLIFLPDMGMAGYLANTTLGAAMYNTLHTETPPILLLCTALARSDTTLVSLSLCWLGHIGFDRMIGAGLKYGSHFRHTHLGRMGSDKEAAA
jgi:hypothetical protein